MVFFKYFYSFRHLPAPNQKRSNNEIGTTLNLNVGSRVLVAKTTIPPYGHRKNWVPRNDTDFADGGSFPEIHIPQYPLDMGREKNVSNALLVKTDKDGKIRYDELIRQGHNKDRIIYSKFSDLLPKTIEDDDPELCKPSQESIEEVIFDFINF